MTDGRGDFPTERANPASADLDRLSALEAVRVMLAEDRSITDAVARARGDIARAVELIAAKLAAGGRLVYAGAGTSGRLGVLDAAECPPTFGTPPQQVQAAIAGGPKALTSAVEGAEDSTALGKAAIAEREIDSRDVVVGISAGGTTPFVHAALAEASSRGAATVFFACVSPTDAADQADVSIRVITGPEVLAGSTRLKAGTATKLVLNMLSTLSMARLGKIHGNLMVDVDTRANSKLVERGIRLVNQIAGVDRATAQTLLEGAQGRVKVAVVMAVRKVDSDGARELLSRSNEVLSNALELDAPSNG